MMARDLKRIDSGNVLELLRLVEEVRESDEPRVLGRDSEDLAILTPVKPPERRAERLSADEVARSKEGILRAVGGWKNIVDAEAFRDYIRERRRTSSRPPVHL
ncbi:MAG: hypothetical protein HYX92_08775 [Chloroflexi bacterium]|nr:hypothetical protein [Chloroflexota bacterium]